MTTKVLPGRALSIARVAHGGQKRKYDEADQDYIVHPERCGERAIKAGMSDVAVAATYGHDIFEDCDPKYKDEIAEYCGAEVFCLICELTNPSKGLKSPRALRKEIDRAHLANVSLDAVRIKLIDRADNLLHMMQAPEDFKRLYLEESDALLTTLTKRILGMEWEAWTDELVDEYEDAWARLRETLK